MKIKSIIFVFIISIGCNEKLPENIMDQNKMIDFLFDVNLINASNYD